MKRPVLAITKEASKNASIAKTEDSTGATQVDSQKQAAAGTVGTVGPRKAHEQNTRAGIVVEGRSGINAKRRRCDPCLNENSRSAQ